MILRDTEPLTPAAMREFVAGHPEVLRYRPEVGACEKCVGEEGLLQVMSYAGLEAMRPLLVRLGVTTFEEAAQVASIVLSGPRTGDIPVPFDLVCTHAGEPHVVKHCLHVCPGAGA